MKKQELKETSIDLLIDIRAQAREGKNWKLSDEIRDHLDSKNVFVFDTKDGQEVYHMPYPTTREELINKINSNTAANNRFDAWLFTQKERIRMNKWRT